MSDLLWYFTCILTLAHQFNHEWGGRPWDEEAKATLEK